MLLVKAPPTIGPITEDTPKMAPIRPWYIGRLSNGVIGIIMTTTPDMTPAEPIPAIARPIMKALEVGAAPHNAEPVSKRIIEIIKMILLLYEE